VAYDNPWTEQKVEDLISLWNDPENYSAGEIGRRMGMTKSQCLGKAHRLGLSLRPSPANLRIGTASLTRKAVAGRAARASSQAGSKFDSPRLVAVPIQRVREIVAQQKSVARDPHKRCLFTSGQRETGYVCCDQLVAVGSPFCPDHRRLGARREAA
jgi:hypothetical protein